MTRALPAMLLVCWPLFAGAFPDLFTARYVVSMNGKEAGVMSREVRREGDQYLFTSELKATRGLYALVRLKVFESSRWRLNNGAIQAVDYTYRQTGIKRRESEVVFDWPHNTVNVVHKDKPSQIPAQDGMLDRLLYQVALMRDLAADRRPIEYVVVDGNKVRNYPIEILGEETIATPMGKLATVRVRYQKPGSERSTTLWCAKSLHYLPVKLDHREDADERTTAIIESVTGLTAAAH